MNPRAWILPRRRTIIKAFSPPDRKHLLACACLIGTAVPAGAQSFLIDMGPSSNRTASPDPTGNTWNSFSPGQFFRLRDTSGSTSASASGAGIGFGATSPVGQSAASGQGLSAPDASLLGDLAVQSATEDFVFRSDDGIGAPETLRFEFSNLDAGLTYSIRFFASRVSGSGTTESLFRITGGNGVQAASLITDGNDRETADAVGVTPSPSGVIAFEVEAVQGGQATLNAIELTVGQPIQFVLQPVGAIVDSGGALTFSALVTPAAGATLQWERDGVPLADDTRIAGAQSGSLTISPADASDVGLYTLSASNGGETIESEVVVGVVRPSPEGPADFNGDGAVDFNDVVSFLRAFDASVGS
ncbi:MAG: immunoglobulin domain-containing protein [Planctomycetota bacterium]